MLRLVKSSTEWFGNATSLVLCILLLNTLFDCDCVSLLWSMIHWYEGNALLTCACNISSGFVSTPWVNKESDWHVAHLIWCQVHDQSQAVCGSFTISYALPHVLVTCPLSNMQAGDVVRQEHVQFNGFDTHRFKPKWPSYIICWWMKCLRGVLWCSFNSGSSFCTCTFFFVIIFKGSAFSLLTWFERFGCGAL